VRWGQRVSFQVPVISGGRTDAPALSGTIFYDWERMGRARWLEAFLECRDGELRLVRSQIAAIRRPTLRPVCGGDVKGVICQGASDAAGYGAAACAASNGSMVRPLLMHSPGRDTPPAVAHAVSMTPPRD